eukprot:8662127-Pyramimonas_sp.AAC.1
MHEEHLRANPHEPLPLRRQMFDTYVHSLAALFDTYASSLAAVDAAVAAVPEVHAHARDVPPLDLVRDACCGARAHRDAAVRRLVCNVDSPSKGKREKVDDPRSTHSRSLETGPVLSAED